jgi:iron complex transport system substrate-binding protein
MAHRLFSTPLSRWQGGYVSTWEPLRSSWPAWRSHLCLRHTLRCASGTGRCRQGGLHLRGEPERHILLLTLLTTLFVAAVTGCAPALAPTPSAALRGQAATSVPATGTPVPPIAQPSSFPVTLTDDLGHQVTVSALPKRLVSLSPSTTETLFAVGAGDQVVGVTKFCNYPPEAQTRQKVGGFSANTISIETIIALKPDLVFSASEIHRPVIEALEQAGIPVFSSNPKDFESVYAAIAAVGRLTGHSAKAAGVVADMKARVTAVTNKTKTLPQDQRPTVFYEVWDEPLMTAGPTTFIGTLIELAGGVNIFADVSEEYPQVSSEEVVRRDPAVILGPDSHGEKLTLEQIQTRPGWGGIQAVREGRIYLVNGDIVSRSGPRLVDALEDIARALHPDLFKQ